MKGQKIQVSCRASANVSEGIASGTVKPGQMLEPVPGTTDQGGRTKYRIRSTPVAYPGPLIVALEDDLQGFSFSHSYSDGDRIFIWFIEQGDEANIYVDVPGTGGGSMPEGNLLECDSAGNLTLAGASPAQVPFMNREAVVDPGTLTPVLTWVQRIN